MSRYLIENEKIKAEIETAGAELKSLKRKRDNREYMWYADATFWGRTSPVLFPFVGSLNDKKYRFSGKEYEMGQHGFARDMEFEMIEQTKDSLRFRLQSDEATIKKYPFDFSLEIGYQLEENKVRVSWKVMNTGKNEMYFSIGGHPAFLCPIEDNTKQSDYYLFFDTNQNIQSDVLENGLISDKLKEYPLENGYLKITEDLFDGDALVIEKNQTKKVALCLPDKSPYLTVCFDAPLFGVWSPVRKNAPFICIEPWYGRADRVGFQKELPEREWGNTLKERESFEASYRIEISE